MWSVGTLLEGNKQNQSLDEYKVECLLNRIHFGQLFKTAWENYFPGCHELFASLNLCSGQVEGGTIFDFNMDMPYLVLLKIDFQAMKAEDILMSEELDEYEMQGTDIPLWQWCEQSGIVFRDRVGVYSMKTWEWFEKWYWDTEEVSEEVSEQAEGSVSNINVLELIRIIRLAMPDLVFKKIESFRSSTYKEVHSFDFAEKGLHVATIDLHFKYNMLTHRYVEKVKELYLMEDGSFRVFLLTCEWEHSYNESRMPDLYKRVIAMDQNINQFDMDTIVASILREMSSEKEVG
ncbi:hypothetical protein PASE110613_14445 [Paenibacillus sediminis]|uniref:Uncharacterized protein n=1 Tax=Paenibacillus sediminis TaxID=664909 RepID=A0ABS4H7L0_9BACL|nr:hypothetical protein [Paenibacillus sediminis]MBP1938513.1 hypothetical protein [Paenibacillus sediminis]